MKERERDERGEEEGRKRECVEKVYKSWAKFTLRSV